MDQQCSDPLKMGETLEKTVENPRRNEIIQRSKSGTPWDISSHQKSSDQLRIEAEKSTGAQNTSMNRHKKNLEKGAENIP